MSWFVSFTFLWALCVGVALLVIVVVAWLLDELELS